MKDLYEHIKQELAREEDMYRKVEQRLKKAPEGHLRVNYRGGTPQYYRCKKGEQTGTYINRSNRKIAEELAQKEYYIRWKECLEKRIQSLQEMGIYLAYHSHEKLWESIHPLKKLLIEPEILSDEEYRLKWEAVQYQGKHFYDGMTEIYTEKGERVRSKSEKIIADKLYAKNIPYRYEYPLAIRGYGTIYPDFMVLNVRTHQEYYLEHFGMMDDPEYAEKAIKKIHAYEKQGIFPGERLLMTFETTEIGCDTQILNRLIEEYLV